MVVKRLRLPTRQHSSRRLSDKIRVAFHAACDEGAVEIAEHLLSQLDLLIHRPPLLPTGFDRRQPEPLTAPAERLANLLLWRVQTEGTRP
jgi:hypothetical protein